MEVGTEKFRNECLRIEKNLVLLTKAKRNLIFVTKTKNVHVFVYGTVSLWWHKCDLVSLWSTVFLRCANLGSSWKFPFYSKAFKCFSARNFTNIFVIPTEWKNCDMKALQSISRSDLKCWKCGKNEFDKKFLWLFINWMKQTTFNVEHLLIVNRSMCSFQNSQLKLSFFRLKLLYLILINGKIMKLNKIAVV